MVETEVVTLKMVEPLFSSVTEPARSENGVALSLSSWFWAMLLAESLFSARREARVEEGIRLKKILTITANRPKATTISTKLKPRDLLCRVRLGTL